MDPSEFARKMLNLRLAWDLPDGRCDYLERIAGAVEGERAVVAGGPHKVGLTLLSALIAFWWAARGGEAILVAPTLLELTRGSWHYLRHFSRSWRETTGPLPNPGEGGWAIGAGMILGTHGRVPGNLGPNVLVVVDQASGVPRSTLEPIATGRKVVALSTPGALEPWFCDALNGDVSGWARFQLDEHSSPNVRAGRIIVPGLVDREWQEEIARDYGVESAFYQHRVRGRFVPATRLKCEVRDTK